MYPVLNTVGAQWIVSMKFWHIMLNVIMKNIWLRRVNGLTQVVVMNMRLVLQKKIYMMRCKVWNMKLIHCIQATVKHHLLHWDLV